MVSAQTRKPLLIVIEGLSGSGKSTVARRLAEELGYIKVEAVQEPFQAAVASLSDDPDAVDARYATFVASMLLTAEAVKGTLAAGRGCVCDSWLFRTHFTHRILGATMEIRDPSWVPVPDHTFWLEVDPAVREARIRSRGTRVDHWKRKLESHPAELKRLYFSGIADLVEIDASKSLGDLVASILNHLPLLIEIP